MQVFVSGILIGIFSIISRHGLDQTITNAVTNLSCSCHIPVMYLSHTCHRPVPYFSQICHILVTSLSHTYTYLSQTCHVLVMYTSHSFQTYHACYILVTDLSYICPKPVMYLSHTSYSHELLISPHSKC